VAIAHERGAAMGAEEVVVAGGGELYAQLIGQAARLAITEVALAPDGDAFFPTIDRCEWREVGRQAPPRAAGDEAGFAFVDYTRMC
jgi:dihydrofolate reductase